MPRNAHGHPRAPTPRGRTNIFAAPERPAPSPGPVEYAAAVDGDNRIIYASKGWNELGPPALPRRVVLRRPITDFVEEPTVRDCFSILFARVRKQDRSARMMTRCDLHAKPRALHLALVPFPEGEIALTWSLIDGPLAAQVPLTPLHRFEPRELLRMCSWCRRVHVEERWQGLEEAAAALGLLARGTLPAITHGICHDCHAALMADFVSTDRPLQQTG